MCLSSVGQIIFGIVLLVAFGLTTVALFTNGWTMLDSSGGNTKQGIMPWQCAKTWSETQNCKDWWNHQPGWLKTVAVCMCLAFIIEIITLIYNLLVFFACCCKSCLMTPLAILSTIITVLLAIAVITYGVNAKDDSINLKHYDPQIGYSFYLALGALLLMVGNTILAFITACLGTMCC